MDDFSVLESSSSSSSRGKRTKPVFGRNQNCFRRDWSSLPRNILLCIMDKLVIIDDYVRFGAVCLAWQTTFLEEISSNRPACSHLPFLLLALPHVDKAEDVQSYHQQRALYSLSRQMVYDFHLGVPYNKICRGSSFGWLITLETKSRYNCHIQLQNPFLNHIIDLPPLDSIIQQHPDNIHGEWDGYYIHKAVLSNDPLSAPDDFVVMSIMSRYRGLAFFKPGNTSWTSIGDDWCKEWRQDKSFSDVIFFHKTKQFYARSSNGLVVAIDIASDGSAPKLTQIVTSPMCLGYPYLVEDLSSGDLLQVYKNTSSKKTKKVSWWRLEKHAMKNSNTISSLEKHGMKNSSMRITVFRLDTIGGNWVHIDHLGDNVIFLGKNASLLRSTSDCPGCEPNCIYYTNDDKIRHRPHINYCGPPTNGIYNLQDATIRPHYTSGRPNVTRQLPHNSSEVLPQPVWLEPTLRRRSPT